jgi:sugar lactone lactonase YvrE
MPRPSIDPVVWEPPPAPALPTAVTLPPLRVLDVLGTGPEDVLVGPDGDVLTGLADGRILRVRPDGRLVEVLADTGGRPLGLEWLPDGSLLVCDADRGLLRVDLPGGGPGPAGVEVLVSDVDGRPMRFCNNAAVAPDGTVYFTDSSRHFGIAHWKADLLEHASTGRLLRRGLSAEVSVLLDGLDFANGVALAPDGSFVLVAETGSYRLTRYWIDSGRSDVLVDNLPGFPDNLSTGTDGLFWVAMGSPRDPMLDRLSSRNPLLRKVVWALPDRFQPRPQRMVWVRAYDVDGALVHDFLGPGDERFHLTTGVREVDGTVHLGSLRGRAVAAFDL